MCSSPSSLSTSSKSALSRLLKGYARLMTVHAHSLSTFGSARVMATSWFASTPKGFSRIRYLSSSSSMALLAITRLSAVSAGVVVMMLPVEVS